MRFGIGTYGLRPDHIVPLARHIEALGFGGLWLGEHIAEPRSSEGVHPYDEGKASAPDVTRAGLMYDIMTMAGAVLGATTKLLVTTGTCLLPLRHPVATARAAISAQQ